MPVVFEAAADAPLAGTLADDSREAGRSQAKRRLQEPVHAADRGAGLRLTRINRFTGRIRAPSKAAVAVTEEVPFKIHIVEPKVPLVHNGSMNLKIVAERQDGFKGADHGLAAFQPAGRRLGRRRPRSRTAKPKRILPMNATPAAPRSASGRSWSWA